MIGWLTDPTQRILERALDGLSLRAQRIASNLANIDTPGARPARIDFETELRSEIARGLASASGGLASASGGLGPPAESGGLASASGGFGSPAAGGLGSPAVRAGQLRPPSVGPSAALALWTTDPRHLPGADRRSSDPRPVADPVDESLRNDANTVDLEAEMTALVETQLRFSAVSKLATAKLGMLDSVAGGR